MKLTKYGKKEWLRATVCAAVLLILCAVLTVIVNGRAGACLAVFVIVVWAAFAAFFRDPERKIPSDEKILTSPADGVVRDIELIPNSNCGNEELARLFEGKDMLRIGIFLSVFDVHLNRAPCRMTVKFTSYKKGCFHDARDGRAAKENESLIMGGIGEIEGNEFPVAVKQVSGAIARRIVCPVEPDTLLKKGERYGMIKFGSRTELYLPVKSNFEPAVSVGDRVFGGMTVIARFCAKQETASVPVQKK
ncbi:MAG TPA: phosphatidylserine decarboxylase family protein [Lentisphaeria bacterium]|nr:phosphatidylserine decarboxylase family protein [Lentisphaeria bacterium]HCG27552.1 phosphatidylserine decarboxylase family protein [Lentisphaeria bacterium]HCG50692.1 phosphatidylserine decarboxylase family protein [Lentisphaeria bacterium]